MNFLGNIIWVIFGGIFIFFEYIIGGLILCLTIVGIPFGIQCFKFAIVGLAPFGVKNYRYLIQHWLFVHHHEHHLAGMWWLLDCTHSFTIWNFILHYHHWHSLRQTAF